MLKCYDQSKIESDILKCDQCKVPFNAYCHPKFLPCFKTICTECVFKIEKEALNKKFECGVCFNEHYIPENGFVLNEKVYQLLASEPIEISRGKEYDQLQANLNKIDSLVKSIILDCENGIDKIMEHCNEQIRLIQLSTEKKIEQINKLNEKLIEKVDQYKNKCIQSFLNKKKLINEEMTRLTKDAQCFLKDKQDYLNQYKTNEGEIKSYNTLSLDLHLTLEEKSINLKNLIFDEKSIKFEPNNSEIETFIIGNIKHR